MTDYLKIPEVARRLDVSEPTARRMIKGGKLPSVFVGGAYRVSEEDLAAYLEDAKVRIGDPSPKVESLPLTSSPQPGEAQRGRPEWLKDLQEQILDRASMYGGEAEDPASPHFQTATAAALWLERVQSESALWADFSLAQVGPFLPQRRIEGWQAIGDSAVWGPWFDAIAPLVVFDAAVRDGERRLEAMNDTPDQLAARRLEQATNAADEARARFEELRTANG